MHEHHEWIRRNTWFGGDWIPSDLIVVKVGGGKTIDIENVVNDLVDRNNYVFIHGGNYELTELQKALGKPPRMVTSISGFESRYTDEETMNCFEMVYAGKINKRIVEMFQKKGVNALGLSGLDGRLMSGKRKPAIKVIEDGKKKVLRGDFTGKVEQINVELLNLLMTNGYVPVITPPAISHEGDPINVDGDRAAAMIASSLNAKALIILSDVPGLLKDVTDPSSLIASINTDEAMEYAKGRMKKKVMGAKEALDAGVQKVIFASANVENPVTNALAGNGTVIE